MLPSHACLIMSKVSAFSCRVLGLTFLCIKHSKCPLSLDGIKKLPYCDNEAIQPLEESGLLRIKSLMNILHWEKMNIVNIQ